MKILELNLPSTNLDAQEMLFRERLGFECKRTAHDRLTIKSGANRLHFTKSDTQYYFHYCFLIPPGCMDSTVAFLDERSFEPLLFNGERIVDFKNGKAVYFYDADGNLAEFIERPSLGHPARSDFKISDVIRLNEIGLPAEEPIAFAKQLIDDYGIEPIGGGLFRDDFVWCGDFEGVLLIPQVGRNWIPCDKAAEINALTVKFETPKGTFEHTVQVG